MTQQPPRTRFRRFWRYMRLALMVVLTIILVITIARGDWADVPITAIFIALLALLEAFDRGWIRLGSGGPPDSR